MSRDHHAWPELLESGGKRAANGLDRDAAACLMDSRIAEVQAHLVQIDKGVDKLTWQHEESARLLSDMQTRHKGLEEDLKRFVFLALAAIFSLVVNLLLSRH